MPIRMVRLAAAVVALWMVPGCGGSLGPATQLPEDALSEGVTVQAVDPSLLHSLDFTPESSERIAFSAYYGTQIRTLAWCSLQAPPAELAPIVFVRNDDLYTMDATGNNSVSLTNTPARYESHPMWSPQARMVVFADAGDIFVMRADGSNRQNLTQNLGLGTDIRPAWSADGSRIVWARRTGDDYEIFVMNSDGSGVTQLTNDAADDRCPSWSPDGNKLAFHSDADGDTEIYVMASDGSSIRQLTDNDWRDEEPAFSPDGRLIAFTSWAGGSGDIYTMRLDGSGLTQLTSGGSDDLSASWSPDGEELCFEAYREGPLSEVYVMDADGSNQRNISYTSPSDFFPRWTSYGSFRRLVGAPGTDSGYDPSLGRSRSGALVAFSHNGLYTAVGITATGGELVVEPVEGDSPLPLVDISTPGRLSVAEDMGRGLPPRLHIDASEGELSGNIKRALVSFNPQTGKVATVVAFAGSLAPTQGAGASQVQASVRGDVVIVSGEFAEAVTYDQQGRPRLLRVGGVVALDANTGIVH